MKLKETIESVKDRWSVCLGMLMIALAAYMLWIRWNTLDAVYVLSQFVMIAFGAIMLFNPVRTIMNNVAIYALGLGLSRIIRAFPLLVDESVFVFLSGCAVMFIGGSMVYTGYMFLRGRARGYRRMIYTASLAFFMMTYMVSLFSYGSIEEYISEYVDVRVLFTESVLMCLLYGLLAFVLMDDRIRSRGFYEMVENDLISTTEITNLPDTLSISTADADIITDRENPGWTRMEDACPAELQHEFDVSTGTSEMFCIVQIWRGDSRVHFTVTANRKGTMIQALRFSAERLIRTEDRLTVVGEDGFIAGFALNDGEEDA